VKVYGASQADVESIVRRVSAESYEGNLVVKDSRDNSNSRGPRATFTMRVRDSAGPGASTGRSPGRGPNGRRRTTGACWHTHWDVLAELFRQFPQARVTTALATYTGATFHDAALATRDRNVGSMMDPVTISTMCACEHWTDGLTPGIPVDHRGEEVRMSPEVARLMARMTGRVYDDTPGTVYTGAYGSDHEPTQTPDMASAASMEKGEPTGFGWLP
jgi:hypothetical protein